MGLLSFLKRRPGADAAAAGPVESADEVQQARTRARRRLVGAAVLVLAGVVGFPLVFDTQPRPVPVDIPIEIPGKDAAVPLVLPPSRASDDRRSAGSTPAAPASAVARADATEVPTESAADAGRDVTPAEKAPGRSTTAAPTAPKPVPAAEPPKPAPSKPAASPGEAQRAQALLEGRATGKEAARVASADKSAKDAEKGKEARDGGRYVVQVGAFADAAAAREVRGKVEKLGLKTYTQSVETSSGNRIRVRAGPFASREEADKALARAKAAGLNAVVLTL